MKNGVYYYYNGLYGERIADKMYHKGKITKKVIDALRKEPGKQAVLLKDNYIEVIVKEIDKQKFRLIELTPPTYDCFANLPF